RDRLHRRGAVLRRPVAGRRRAAGARAARDRRGGRRDRVRLLHDPRDRPRPLRPAAATAVAMWLRVEHRTTFAYDAPIAEAYTELRLRPLRAGGHNCTSFRLETDPPGVRVREYRDHFGNEVLHFDVLERHDRLEVRAL